MRLSGARATVRAASRRPPPGLFLVAVLLLAAVGGNPRPAQGAAGDTIADSVLGQPAFASNVANNPALGGLGARSLASPLGVAVDAVSGRLFVADTSNHRILSWPSATGFGNGQAADLVLGQPDFTSNLANRGLPGPTAATLSSPNGLALDRAGNLSVADNGNSRALTYAAPLSSGMPATRVFGQPNFTSGGKNNGGLSARTLANPVGVAVDHGGDVFVADTQNNRVLEYVPPFPVNAGIAASRTFGQPDFTSNAANSGGLGLGSLDLPLGLAVDAAGDLFVADAGNSRVLELKPPFQPAGNVAAVVLGQPDFTHATPGVTANRLEDPGGVSADSGGVYVADVRANRAVRYRSPFSNGMAASFVVGQPDCVTGTPNTGGVSAASLLEPWNLTTDPGGNLYVADTYNNRLLGYDRPSSSILCASPWSFTGSMNSIRYDHTATLLTSGPLAGQVLIAGGRCTSCPGGGGVLSSAELYDPASGQFHYTGSLNFARLGQQAILLPDGRVLVVGGSDSRAAEIYDPTTGTWRIAASSTNLYDNHTATLLGSGKVLVVQFAAEEIYDPATDSWSPAAKPTTPRGSHTATLLPNGKVLIAGGLVSAQALASAELYDPATDTWSPTGSLTVARYEQTATLLQNGKVWVAGGFGADRKELASTELYDPASGVWSPGPALFQGRGQHTATLLHDGRTLIAGGEDGSGNLSEEAEIYDPSAGAIASVSQMNVPHDNHTATTLLSGKVLVTGGFYNRSLEISDCPCVLTTLIINCQCVACESQVDVYSETALAELFDPSLNPSSPASAPAARRLTRLASPSHASISSSSPVPTTLYALRDQVMAKSPQGQYYTRLFYLNSPEMAQIALIRPDLIDRSASTLQEWQPALQSLVNGQGSTASINQQMITDLNDVLNQFKILGSPRLATTIQREQDALKLQDFVGLNLDQAQALAQQRIVVRSLPSAYLPRVAR